MKNFWQKLFSDSGDVSSKRVMGVIGWFICLFICVWCTVGGVPAPEIVEYLFICSASLLGIDSVMKPFKKGGRNETIKGDM